MPEFTAHHLFGECVLKKLPSMVAETAHKQPEAFFWGLHGPDVLYYTKLIRDRGRVARAGIAAHHNNPEGLFEAMLTYIAACRHRPDYDTLCAYLLGFVCHYELDRATHPFVYYQISLRTNTPRAGRHAAVESEIGSLLYREMTGRPVSSFCIDEAYPRKGAFVAPVSEMYASVIAKLYGFHVTPREVAACFPFCLRLNKLAFRMAGSSGGIMMKSANVLIRSSELLSSFLKTDVVDYDTLNLDKKPWFNVNDPSQLYTESFPELFSAAQSKAVALSLRCAAMLGNGHIGPLGLYETFDNGEPIKLRKRIKARPVKYKKEKAIA